MQPALSIQEILASVKALDKQTQLTLLGKLVAMIVKEEKDVKATRLSSISGIGANIWRTDDIEKYIAEQRQW